MDYISSPDSVLNLFSFGFSFSSGEKARAEDIYDIHVPNFDKDIIVSICLFKNIF